MKYSSENKQTQIILAFIILLLSSINLFSCQSKYISTPKTEISVLESIQQEAKPIVLGAEQIDAYFPLLVGKKVGIVTNQTGIIPSKTKNIHLVDLLLDKKINIVRIFAPEHGFRGEEDAGAHIENGVDSKTGIPIISLYGNNKKPKSTQISDLDVVIFDIQDVGVRFYTYISTLHLVMEAVAENNKQIIVLDRPNPNAHYIDGPMLEPKFKSFVGMHKIPVVYGMTIGEYAQMINGESWLENGIKAILKVIPLKNYNHKTPYSLPVKPSPNLPNDISINLYPSLCFFEGTNVSIGRGTEMQFQVYGSPFFRVKQDFTYTPKPNLGAKSPKHNGVLVSGKDLRKNEKLDHLELKWLVEAYKMNTKEPFFDENLFFDKLAGTDKLRKSILKGESIADISKAWQADLEAFKLVRKKYLLYAD